MNDGLLKFPKSDQLLRGSDLLKLNKHLNGFPLPASHPKIVNGLHAFPKQDYEFGIYYAAGTRAVNNNIFVWELGSRNFTIELCAQLIKVQLHGFTGYGHSNFSYNNTYSDGWGFCSFNDIRDQYFKIQSATQSLSYSFNLNITPNFDTHTIVRLNEESAIKYYFNGRLVLSININPNLNVGRQNVNMSGFNIGLSSGFSNILKFLRISNIARDENYILNNYNNKFALDANTTALYNHYIEGGMGTVIHNVANTSEPAIFGSGASKPFWVLI